MEKDYLYVNHVAKDVDYGAVKRSSLPFMKKVKYALDPDARVYDAPKTIDLQPSPKTTMSEPTTANTPLILSPNIPGGMKVDNPSPVNVLGSNILSGLPDLRNIDIMGTGIVRPDVVVETPAGSVTVDTSAGGPGSLQAFGLSTNMVRIIGMVIAAVVLFVVFRKK